MHRTSLALVALSLTLSLLGLPGTARADEAGESPEVAESSPSSAAAGNMLDVWKAEHRWFRLGMRFYGMSPAIDDHAALKLGAAVSVPLTTDFFMGIGMRVAFVGAYNLGDDCVGSESDVSSACPSGHPGGVDYIWKEPRINGVIDGSNGNAQPGADFVDPARRKSHVASYSLSIGANYELTLPTIKFFRTFQPFFGGGVVLAWVYTYSDITAAEFVLINNSENDPWDDSNIDPWSSQGPEVGGEVYGGFHLNIKKTFRFTFEVGYQAYDVPAAPLNKATEGYEAQHLSYRLAQTRFGGGFEFRF